jgi:hypothetical protein
MKKEFIVNRQGKDFVLYAGLLDQAHREGLKRISTKLLQAPSDENGHLAICYAEVETEKGVFSGIGDASPDSVGRMIAMHTVRMSETRAKARALRDAINVGVTAFEELGDVDEDTSMAPLRQADIPRPRPVSAVPRPAPGNGQAGNDGGAKAVGVPTPDGPAAASGLATQQQIDRLLKLQTAIGRPAMVSQTLTSEEAAAQIRELVGIFNSQSRGGRSQAR